ncbi:MAG: hypothetical protein OEV87_12115, partial [Phycisphaerae bacterium]|nr:hypothetical protein [Phycisphaerae bacterium]
MKKILVSLLVLALCAPAMAATVTINDNADGTGTIVVDAGAGNSIVGLGLNIDATGGNITALSIDATANPTFNIYPDAAHDREVATPGSYTYGAGTPIADQVAAGEVAVGNNVAISVGCLNGASTPGATGAQTITINVTVDATTNICVSENALRGGIVLTDGTGVDIDGTTVCGDVTAGGCYTGPDQAQWDLVGKPDSWCLVSQCHGDANGTTEVISKVVRQVGYQDINILVAGFNKAYVDPVSTPWIAADFNHAPETISKVSRRVGYADINILLAWFNKSGVP